MSTLESSSTSMLETKGTERTLAFKDVVQAFCFTWRKLLESLCSPTRETNLWGLKVVLTEHSLDLANAPCLLGGQCPRSSGQPVSACCFCTHRLSPCKNKRQRTSIMVFPAVQLTRVHAKNFHSHPHPPPNLTSHHFPPHSQLLGEHFSIL